MTRELQKPLPAPPPGRPVPRKRDRCRIEKDSSVNIDAIASFKRSPTILPKDIKTIRPFTGLCCDCLPTSKQNLIKELNHDNGVCNIFNVNPYLRNSSWIQKQFPILSFSLQRRNFHQYPDVSIAVFTNNRLLEAIQKTSIMSFSRNFHNGDVDVQALQTSIVMKAKTTLRKMKANVSLTLLRFTGWFLNKFLSIFLSNILVHRGQMKMVQKAAEQKVPMIYLPLHRSHLDYILITYILWNYNVRAPFVAAGDNLDIPFFNKLMRGLGGFFIRRRLDTKSGEKDVIYRTLLHTYLEELLKQGEGMEFFIEGGRCRSGKSNLPKGGLLSIITEACSQGHIPDAFIIPISIGYDKLIDGNFTREQMGLSKKPESFFRAVKAIVNVLIGDYGSVRMDFAQPFSLKEFILCHQNSERLNTSSSVDSSPDSPPNMEASYPCFQTAPCLTSEIDRQIVNDLARHVIYTATGSTSLMSTNLLSFLLLTKYRNGTNIGELSQSFDKMVKEIRDRGRDIGFCGTSTDAVHSAVALLGTKLVHVTIDPNNEDILLVKPNISLPAVYELMYYSNVVLSVYILESVVAVAIIYSAKTSSVNSEKISEVEITTEQILASAEEISRILDQEFIFVPPCKHLNTELSDIIDSFINMEILYQEAEVGEVLSQSDRRWSKNLCADVIWAEDDDDDDEFYAPAPQKYKVNLTRDDNYQKMIFLLSVISPTFECYLTTAHFIDVSLKTEMAEDDFIRQLNQFAKSQVTESRIEFNESSAMDALKICVKSFHRLKILDFYSAGNLRMLGLHEDFNVKDRLMHFIKLLESVKI